MRATNQRVIAASQPASHPIYPAASQPCIMQPASQPARHNGHCAARIVAMATAMAMMIVVIGPAGGTRGRLLQDIVAPAPSGSWGAADEGVAGCEA